MSMLDDEVACCEECFADHVLRQRVSEAGAAGDCPRCGSVGVMTVSPGELEELFEPVVGLYQISQIGVDRLPDEDAFEVGEPLLDHLEGEWGVFSELLSREAAEELLDHIINYSERQMKPKEQAIRDVSDMWVRTTAEFTYRSPEEVWRGFTFSLQHERRFIPKEGFDGPIPPKAWLPEYLEEMSVRLTVDSDWYRCRTSVNWIDGAAAPLPAPKMGAPPPDHAPAGRANPSGIPFLYASSDQATTLAEKRCWKGQIVSVATVAPREDIDVIDLTSIPYLDSPFGKTEGILPFLIERVGIIRHLADLLAQPFPPDEIEAEYLPTQYLTELIRDAGYAGMIYPSAMGQGRNLVIFDPDMAIVGEGVLVEITDVTYQTA